MYIPLRALWSHDVDYMWQNYSWVKVCTYVLYIPTHAIYHLQFQNHVDSIASSSRCWHCHNCDHDHVESQWHAEFTYVSNDCTNNKFILAILHTNYSQTSMIIEMIDVRPFWLSSLHWGQKNGCSCWHACCGCFAVLQMSWRGLPLQKHFTFIWGESQGSCWMF